jgi:RimJ/RimL family protein N-acetyltransferase
VLGLERVEADVDEHNKASIRVLEALGMSRTRRAIVNERPLLYYEIQSERKKVRSYQQPNNCAAPERTNLVG